MNKLKEARLHCGLTQKELSESSGVKIRLIQDYEQGHKQLNGAKAITIYALANALNCTMESLITIE